MSVNLTILSLSFHIYIEPFTIQHHLCPAVLEISCIIVNHGYDHITLSVKITPFAVQLHPYHIVREETFSILIYYRDYHITVTSDKASRVPLSHHSQAPILSKLESHTIVNYRYEFIAILINRSLLPISGDICNPVDKLSRRVIDKRYNDVTITIHITIFAIPFRTYTDTCSSVTEI